MPNRESQKRQIIAALLQGDKITPLDAFKRFGCLRLGGRIFELKDEGWPVKSEIVTLRNKKRVARYFLESIEAA